MSSLTPKTFLIGTTILAGGILIAVVGASLVQGFFATRMIESTAATGAAWGPETLDLDISFDAEAQELLRISRRTVVSVVPDGSILLNNEPAQLEELRRHLVERVAVLPDHAVVLKADKNTPYQKVTEILDLARETGIGNISIATTEPAEEPLEAEPAQAAASALEISLDAEGNLALNGEPLDQQALAKHLEALGETQRAAPVVVHADHRSKHSQIVEILSALKKADIQHVTFSPVGTAPENSPE